MTMAMHVVRQGDHLASIAQRYGVSLAEIWDHPNNAGLREERGEGNILEAGDVLFVPDVEAELLDVSKGQTNAFIARVPLVPIRIRLVDEDNAPLSGKAFRVDGPATPIEGTTDGDGVAEFEVPMTLRVVALRLVDLGRVWPIKVAYLDPVTSDSGVRSRLRNMGYLRGSDDPETDTANALRSFQQAEGLEVTGEVDEEVREALVRRHGS